MSEELIQQALMRVERGALAADDDRYVDLDPVRGAPMTRVRRMLRAADVHGQGNKHVRFALAGQRGSGKSTELARLASTFDQRRVIQVSMRNLLGKGQLSPVALALAAIVGVDRWVGKYSPYWMSPILDEGAKLLNQLTVPTMDRPWALGFTAVGQIASQVLISGTAELGRESDIVAISQLVNSILRTFREHDGHEMVLLIDDLDKFDLEQVAELICGDSPILSFIECHAIVTAPAAIIWHEGKEDTVKLVATTAIEVVEKQSSRLNPEALDLLRTLVYRRVPQGLFLDGQDTVDDLVSSSGGSLGDLLFLIEECLLRAQGGIGARDIDAAKRKLTARLRPQVRTPADDTILARLSHGYPLTPDNENRHLIEQGCVLVYDLSGWFGVHPLLRSAVPVHRAPSLQEPVRYKLRWLELQNFRCFPTIEIPVSAGTGWTCLAGINGAGKSSVLQAIALLLLGPNLGAELGGAALAALRRNAEKRATITGVFEDEHGSQSRIALDLTDGPEAVVAVEGNAAFWEQLHSVVFLSYGATRNLSGYLESRHSHMRVEARRQMTLFDPLTQLTSAAVLLQQTPETARVGTLFTRAISSIFGPVLRVHSVSAFQLEGDTDSVSALNLPDGFRSSAAWIADLCAAWCDKNPQFNDPSPSDVEALVMIDEIDLHLHPSLQRQLVPRLRETFPKVQWIVTTHSPLVLANFSRDELVALDRTAPGGIRHLDREIKGFTADEIYAWLMDTLPSGVAIEEELAKAEAGAPSPELAAILRTSPAVNEEQARELVSRSRSLLEDLRPE